MDKGIITQVSSTPKDWRCASFGETEAQVDEKVFASSLLLKQETV